MNLDLTGKHALVCGASRGIGRACAVELAALGARVTLLARDAAELEAVRAALDGGDTRGHAALAVDLADTGGLPARIEAHLASHGPALILLNNSGGPAAGPVEEAEPGQFEKTFAQHLLASHLLAMAVLPGMKAAAYGRIVNIISTSVKIPIPGLGVSNTIRAAVASWAKTLAGEVARHGITVNNVLPGSTDTRRMAEIVAGKAARFGKTVAEIGALERAAIPAGRFATPEEIAAAVAFLASPAASYITGINLPVDGGRTGCL